MDNFFFVILNFFVVWRRCVCVLNFLLVFFVVVRLCLFGDLAIICVFTCSLNVIDLEFLLLELCLMFIDVEKFEFFLSVEGIWLSIFFGSGGNLFEMFVFLFKLKAYFLIFLLLIGVVFWDSCLGVVFGDIGGGGFLYFLCLFLKLKLSEDWLLFVETRGFGGISFEYLSGIFVESGEFVIFSCSVLIYCVWFVGFLVCKVIVLNFVGL